MLPVSSTDIPWSAMPIRRLSMTASHREKILLHLLDALPNEGVALLAVHLEISSEGVANVAHVFPGTNMDASPVRFTMDPTEVLAADRQMRAAGWRLGAIVHSHVTSPATPSATDMREAFYPDALLLIVTFAVHPAEFRAWRIDREDDTRIVRGVPIHVVQPVR